MTPLLMGGLLGAAFGVGLLMTSSRLLASRRPSLKSRVTPYIRDVQTVAPAWTPVVESDRASSALAALLRPLIKRAAERLERIVGGRESVARRLQRSGSSLTVEGFRFSQVVWGIAGFATGMALGLLGPAREPGRAVAWFIVCCGFAIVSILARDGALTRAVKNREQQLLEEFPLVADLLALSVAAGESPGAALGRVVATCHGALPDEFGVVLAQSRTGVPLATALDSMAQRSGLAAVSRFADGLAVAIERGTPLVDTLNAQAGETCARQPSAR